VRRQQPGHAHQLRLLLERRQHLLERLEQQRAARTEHAGLRFLAARQGFEVAPLRFAEVLSTEVEFAANGVASGQPHDPGHVASTSAGIQA
jgi:hypothetical protein